ncbi:ABC transporter substrate-binding protein [Demequina sp. B12]|uniref:ABC transporter substrate-binding protein n=1 Tax=Demequina sp. B12 TaxID=2992757 RepID=UPI00237B44AA|nr:ABC transporter substrate-binding protein [Demequina sp. B12]MDE0571940.1 ABC transporter substrate-binding protein [Demequina sp. B12]
MMIRTTGRKRVIAAASMVAGLSLLVAGCSDAEESTDDPTTDATTSSETTDSASAGVKTDRELVVWAGAQTPINQTFNPFVPEVQHLALGGVYESLFYYNKAGAGDPKPLLGESFEWNEDGTQLTISIREGVKWNDGEDFTTDDVIYSFTNSIAGPDYITGAEATDDSTVVLTFDEPQFTNELSVLGLTWMIPQHVWADIEDTALEFANLEPVGTGPYTIGSISDANYTGVANPDYWAGEPNVTNVRYIGIDGNQSAEDLLRTGQIDWVGMFVPEPDGLIDAGIGYINTPQDPAVLYTCSNADLGCEGDQTDVAVRQALNLAIDRTAIKDKAFVGLTGTISPTFALLGRDDKWISPDVEAESPQSPNIEEAQAILEEAGYTKGDDGFYAKDGDPIEMSLTSVDGWTDFNNAAKLIEEQAAAAGIKVTAATVSWNEFADGRTNGDYELIMGGMIGTSVADPFQLYKDWLGGDATTPAGTALEPGDWNFSRYDNDIVNEQIQAAAATNDEATKMEAYAVIQEEIVRDLPYIPIVINATQTFYNQTDYTGWPTEDNLFAFPPAWGSGAAGVVLSSLGGAE